MSHQESRLIRHVRGRMSRGFEPIAAGRPAVTYLRDDIGFADDTAGWVDDRSDDSVRIGFVLPTHVRRSTLDQQSNWFADLLVRLDEVCAAHPGTFVAAMVGMQWMTDEEQTEAARRLTELAGLAERYPCLRFVGMSLRGPNKVRTLNAGIGVADAHDFTAVGWLDDDVRLEPDCLQQLVHHFVDGGCRGAVGATKIPHTLPFVTSRLLYKAKALTATATNYPHGCCILVARAVVAGGIPERYVCDDGYVCFRLLDPDADDPLHDLRLVPDAKCHYHVAGRSTQSARKIRRLLLNHNIYLADWSYPVARYYFRDILFAGMWPLGTVDRSVRLRRGLAKAAVKWLYFGWFAKVAAELYLRGALRRPLRQVDWGEIASVQVAGPVTKSELTEARA